jgi:hypothetical protein
MTKYRAIKEQNGLGVSWYKAQFRSYNWLGFPIWKTIHRFDNQEEAIKEIEQYHTDQKKINKSFELANTITQTVLHEITLK